MSLSRAYTKLATTILVLALLGAQGVRGDSELRRVELPVYRPVQEVTLDIGEMIAAGMVQPKAAISIDTAKPKCWLLRTPKSAEGYQWYRNLLNTRPDAPDLTIDTKLSGVYDIYAQVRAVHSEGPLGMDAKPSDLSAMAFVMELDDGSQREAVVAKGFPEYHFDTEVLAGCRWNLDGRKIILRSFGKPVYLYALRFAPAKMAPSEVVGETAQRWLATDHVTIVKEENKHFAFPGVAILKNGDIAVVYREATVHATEAIGKISLSRSKDGGRTWLPRVTAVDRPGVDERDPTILQLSDGTVMLFSADYSCMSNDYGETWSDPKPTPVFGPKGAVEDEQGHVVYGGLRRVVQRNFSVIAGKPATLQANAVWRSKDKGLSWEEAGIATYTLYKPGPYDYVWYDEPFMCVVPDKCWVMASRVDLDGFARIVRSTDRGKTWGEVTKTPVWGYPQHLLPLRDGRLLMTYGYRRPPFGVRACLSNDNGKTWDIENEIIIRMDAGPGEGQQSRVGASDLGYPMSKQLDDGRIFSAYYFNKGQSNCYIAGTFWALPSRILSHR